jgi:hypothetical protein
MARLVNVTWLEKYIVIAGGGLCIYEIAAVYSTCVSDETTKLLYACLGYRPKKLSSLVSDWIAFSRFPQIKRERINNTGGTVV